MKPETEAKAIIGFIIALIAFGCGSGAGIVMGMSQNNTSNVTKVNNSSEMPQIQSTKNVNINNQPQTTSNPDNTNSESVDIQNKQNNGNNGNNSDQNPTTNQT